MSVSAKPKRRNSDKRKEKSRDAARCRRGQETEIFSDLAHQLPVSYSLLAQLDKASIIRLSIAHIKLRSLLTNVDIKHPVDELPQKVDHQFYKSLDGFVLLVSTRGDIIYVSENVEKYLGITQVDIAGHSVFDFTHPCDHDELRDLVCDKSTGGATDDKQRALFVRMKCTLTSKGRNINIKSAAYKVVHMSGSLLNMSWQTDDLSSSSFIVLIGRPLADLVNADLRLDDRTFVSRLSMDLRFIYCDEEVIDLLGYSPDDLVHKSLYKFHHAFDAEVLDKAYRSLFVKGQSMTGLYRFLAKTGGYVWMETQAAIIGEMQSERSRSIMCINRVISTEIECEDQILADIQLANIQQLNHVVVPTESVVIEDDADEVVVYEEDEEEDDMTFSSGMQLVTEKLLGIKVLPYLSGRNVSSGNRSPTTVIIHQGPDESVPVQPGMPLLDNLLDELDCGMEMRAPYIPMDDMSFGSPQPSVVDIDNKSTDASPMDLST